MDLDLEAPEGLSAALAEALGRSLEDFEATNPAEELFAVALVADDELRSVIMCVCTEESYERFCEGADWLESAAEAELFRWQVPEWEYEGVGEQRLAAANELLDAAARKSGSVDEGDGQTVGEEMPPAWRSRLVGIRDALKELSIRRRRVGSSGIVAFATIPDSELGRVVEDTTAAAIGSTDGLARFRRRFEQVERDERERAEEFRRAVTDADALDPAKRSEHWCSRYLEERATGGRRPYAMAEESPLYQLTRIGKPASRAVLGLFSELLTRSADDGELLDVLEVVRGLNDRDPETVARLRSVTAASNLVAARIDSVADYLSGPSGPRGR